MSRKIEVLEMVTLLTTAVRRAYMAIQGIPQDVAVAVGAMRKIESNPELKKEFEAIMADLEDYDLNTFKKQFEVIRNSVRFESPAKAEKALPEEPKEDVPTTEVKVEDSAITEAPLGC